MDIIVKMIFGSHLYGTNTKDSDTDYKGVFLPSEEQIILNKVPKSYNETTGKNNSKNSSEDVDTEIYSLHYFITLACEGQTVAFDMLHAQEDMIIEKSDIWDDIVSERHRFYTRSLKAFVGYARRQAAKYGVKGSRLSSAKYVIEFLSKLNNEKQLKDYWDMLPLLEYVYKDTVDKNGLRLYEICGKNFQETTRIGYVIPILEKFYTSYGARAKQAEQNEGIDWKAISHAMRAALQTKQLLTENTIKFPLKEADYLKKVKSGQVDYLTEALPYLESLMGDVELLSKTSDLPEKVDRNYWDRFIIDVVKKHYFS
jgi:predicted nucleotidyltransferase